MCHTEDVFYSRPKITVHPDWIPEVGEKIQLVFTHEFQLEAGGVGEMRKTRIKTNDTHVDEVICQEEEGRENNYVLVANVMGHKCWIKLAQTGLARFESSRFNHAATGLPNVFWVLRFKEPGQTRDEKYKKKKDDNLVHGSVDPEPNGLFFNIFS